MPLLHLLYFLIVLSTCCHGKTCPQDNCLLPSCQCPIINDHPKSLNFTDLPQFILLTFVGSLTKNSFQSIRSILNLSRRNPNKCSISSTFFIHNTGTEYCLVQRLFDNYNEIAMTTSSNGCPLTNCYNEKHWHRWTYEDWKNEIKEQRRNIVEYAQIHPSHIKGFRVPHLQIDQNEHFEILHQLHFHYDSSMLFKRTSLIWPFTLNYPFNHIDCINCNQSIQSLQALWQFPLHEWTYLNATTSCRTLFDSSCLPTNQSHSIDLLFHFLMHNFERHSSPSIGYRSPFVIQLDLARLSQHNNQHLRALIRFIDYILNSPAHRYVYFVSIEKALEWFKYPCSLNNLQKFWAFTCGDKFYSYDIDCSDPESNENGPENLFDMANAQSLESNYKSKPDYSATIDYQGEKLFPSSIISHAVWMSVLLILSVFFYDKYFVSQ